MTNTRRDAGLFDVGKVTRAVRILHETGGVFELRALGVRMERNNRTFNAISGFFNSPDALVGELGRITSAKGIYVTLNPVEPQLLERAVNRINGDAPKGSATKDFDIARRRWLLIDLDPKRPRDTSATEAELSLAKEKSKAIHAFLKERCWSQPVCALSGNGIHLLYRVDLPQDDGGLLQRVLLALSQKFDDEGVEVDKAVHNPSRITKLYGTLACKGDHSPERPHRMSDILKEPSDIGVVSREQLESVAALVVDENEPQKTHTTTARPVATQTRTGKDFGAYDANAFVRDFVAKHGITVARTETKNTDTYYMLDLCPWASEHGGADKPGDAAIIVQPSGELGFKCFHSHCSNRHWKDLRLMFEPDFEQRRSPHGSRIVVKQGVYTGETSSSTATSGSQPVADSDSVALRAKFFEVSQDKALLADGRYKAMALATIETLNRRGRFYYHAERRDFATEMYFDCNRRLLSLISSDEFRAWLSRFTGLNLSERAFDFIVSACKTESLAGKTTGIVPATYWHATPAAIYLSNGDEQAVRITAGKCETVVNGTDDVLFPVGQTLKPWSLTEPVDPFESCRLFRDAATSEEGKELLRLYLLSLPTGQRCHPPILLTGQVGSGKTRLAVGMFEVFGLSPRIVALNEKGEDDFWTQVDSGGLVCFDNADTRLRWLPDALAAASTDGAREKRQLYTDGRIIRQHARAWTVITSANPTFASDAGLADRLLVTRLDLRTTETAESALSKEIAEQRDACLSWIARTLATALEDTAPVPTDLNRRHPDFAAFAVRLGRAVGRETQAIAALRSAEEDKGRINLENDEVGSALLELGDWQGTTAELLEALTAIDDGFGGKWSAKRLGKRISRLWTHLASVLNATKETEGHSKKIVYRFQRACGVCGVSEGVFLKVPRDTLARRLSENASQNPANTASPSDNEGCLVDADTCRPPEGDAEEYCKPARLFEDDPSMPTTGTVPPNPSRWSASPSTQQPSASPPSTSGGSLSAFSAMDRTKVDA